MSLLVRAWVPTRTLSSTERLAKQSDVLEGAADADFGDPVRRPLQDALAFHQDVAGARLVEPAQAIEQRGLAGAVRPDQAEDLALMHVERHAVQRDDAAEHDADVANREQGMIVPARAVPASFRCARTSRRAASAARTSPPAIDDARYLIPSTTRATFPPALNFLLSSFFDCGEAPPSAASMFLTIATRRGPISLRNRSSVKRNAGAPQLKA